MKIKISERHTTASPALREYVVARTEALERFFDRIVSVDVVLSVEKERQIADFHAHLTNRKLITAREESTDMYASIDKAVDRLRRQLLKFKDQLQDVRGHAVGSSVQGEEGEERCETEIVRTETYFQKPMTPEEAVQHLEAIERDFLVFIDVETDQVAIIYHRRDGKYGLIEPRK